MKWSRSGYIFIRNLSWKCLNKSPENLLGTRSCCTFVWWILGDSSLVRFNKFLSPIRALFVQEQVRPHCQNSGNLEHPEDQVRPHFKLVGILITSEDKLTM